MSIGAVLSALGKELAKPQAVGPKRLMMAPLAGPEQNVMATAVPAVKPVLQLADLPLSINPDHYRNALSSTNPEGDLRAARAFRDLVDPVPPFERGYVPTAFSVEANYGLVVGNAQVQQQGSVAQMLLARAQRSFVTAAQPSLDGTPDNHWRLVDAVPSDWWDTSDPTRFQKVDLDLDGGGKDDFTILGGSDTMSWRVDGKAATPLHPATKLKTLSFRYQSVLLRRNWCDPTVFTLGGWKLVGEPAGFCSSGGTEANVGILPLLPTCILVGCDVTLAADWAPADAKMLDAVGSLPVSLGPFPLERSLGGGQVKGSPPLFLAAVISTLVPYSPQVG